MGTMVTNWLMEESYSFLKISDLLYFKPFYQLQNKKKRKAPGTVFQSLKKVQNNLEIFFLSGSLI